MASISPMSVKNQIKFAIVQALDWYIQNRKYQYQLLLKTFNKKVSPQRELLTEEVHLQDSQLPAHDLKINYQQLFHKFQPLSVIENGLWQNIKDHSPHSLSGFIPYMEHKTSVVIHHFFSTNYGVRKPFLGHIALVKEGKFIAVKRFTLPPQKVTVFDLKELFPHTSADIVFVELFHPRIPKNHGGHHGHVRFWGSYDQHASTVHSMPIEKYLRRPEYIISPRAVFPKSLATETECSKQLYFWGGKSDLDPQTTVIKKATRYGFYSQKLESQDQHVSSLWHGAIYTGKKAPHHTHLQAVGIPPIRNTNQHTAPRFDVHMSFHESVLPEINSSESSSQKEAHLTFFRDDGKEFGPFPLRIQDPTQTVSLSELQKQFQLESENFSGGFLLVDFRDMSDRMIHSGYINTTYAVGSILGDNVHSHNFHAYNLLKKSTTHKDVVAIEGQSMKFMHFPITEFESYLALWTLEEPTPIKLRFILDDFTEILVNKTLDNIGVQYFHLQNILKDSGYAGKSTHAVVQVESLRGNPNGNVYTFNDQRNSLSVDHLTGG